MVQPPQAEWARQWARFRSTPDSAHLFSEWIHPNTLDLFRGKRVLDAGCGSGQHARLVARYARQVVAADLNTAEVARQETGALPNAEVVAADIALMQAAEPFDVVYCVGVIHHTDDPDRTFENLKRLTRTGGRLIVWAYSREGNLLNRTVLEWVRSAGLKRLPFPALRAIAFGTTLLLYSVVWSLYLLPLRGVLPFYEYFANFRRLSFRHNVLNVLDKLNAPQTRFIPRSQVERWFNPRDFSEVHISPYRGVSWRGSGTKR
jgi:SAM-dependent methyltransferase